MEIYATRNTCSRQIMFDVDENLCLRNVRFIGGCSGNARGISKLVDGMNINEVIEKLEGTICASRGTTSCPDQLAKALIQYKAKNNIQ